MIVVMAIPTELATQTTTASAPILKETTMGVAEFNPIIWLVGLSVIILTVIAVYKGGIAKKAGFVKGWFDKLIVAQTGNYQSWLQPIKVIAALTLVFILVAVFWPALWQWLRGQKIFWLVVVVLPILAAVATKYKWARWLVIPVTVIGLLATDWREFPHPQDWRLPGLEKANEAARNRTRADVVPADPTARAASSGVNGKTIIARPKPVGLEGFEPHLTVPFYHDYWWSLKGGCIRIENAFGESIDSCPGEKPSGKLSESTGELAVWALEEKEVIVTFGWKPY